LPRALVSILGARQIATALPVGGRAKGSR
jgi:hypothetical protein